MSRRRAPECVGRAFRTAPRHLMPSPIIDSHHVESSRARMILWDEEEEDDDDDDDDDDDTDDDYDDHDDHDDHDDDATSMMLRRRA